MRAFAVVAALLAFAVVPAESASVSKTYSYFSVGGTTLEELEVELARRGPQVQSTGRRHPGATQMEFTSRVGYLEQNGYCRVASAEVQVKANVILPRWTRRNRAERDERLIWDTLSADIKRHEESHVIIARRHARELRDSLLALDRNRSCERVAERVRQTTQRLLARHDAAQERFDRIEGINFESRMMRLLRYRLEQIEAGRIPG